ncbi:MAG: SPOR domain-containing protein [Acidiferrobacterales bacterium]
MAEPEDSSRSFNPKHRIIGAVVLVALAVLLIPFILRDHKAKPQTAPPVATTASSGIEAVAPVPPPLPMTPGGNVPPPATPAAATPSAVAPAPVVAPQPAQPPAAEAMPAPVPRPMPEVVPVHERRHPPVNHAVRVARGWIVQVGAFSRRQNALHVRETLEHKGFRAELDRVRIGNRRGVRVRVGPVRSRREARILEAHIARQTGIKGVVLMYP